MKFSTALFSLFLSVAGFAQAPTSGLVAYYPMDDCSLLDAADFGSNGTVFGTTCDSCGVEGKGISFGGFNPSNNDNDYALLLGTVNNSFKTTDFSISFYMKPKNNVGTRDIISKREDCSDENAFAIQFVSPTNSINVVLSENNGKKANVNAALDFGRCWQHVLFVRRNKSSLLYINGILKAERDSPDGTPVNVDNNAVLSIANSPCQATLELPYVGILDEFRIYKKALNENEIALLYNNPHQILTQNTTVFLGETVDIEATEGCNVDYQWLPDTFLSSDDEVSVSSTPDSSITYVLSYSEDLVCIAYDTINITVIDPNTLDCGEVYLPKAFTPNNDGLNDTYHISNPHVVDLLSFEIYDRWGSRIFYTENEFEEWDGSFRGKPLNPGVLLYKVRYVCNGEEKFDVGSLAIMR